MLEPEPRRRGQAAVQRDRDRAAAREPEAAAAGLAEQFEFTAGGRVAIYVRSQLSGRDMHVADPPVKPGEAEKRQFLRRPLRASK